jgi:hypothetical protein
MKRITYFGIWITLLFAPALSHAGACKVTTTSELLKELIPKANNNCLDTSYPGAISIEVQNDINLITPIILPDHTRLYGKLPTDPYSPAFPKLTTDFSEAIETCTIKLGNNSTLSNLSIDNAQSSTAIVCALGNSNIIARNQISGTANVGVLLGYIGAFSNYNVVMQNVIATNQGVGVAVLGFNNIINQNNIGLSEKNLNKTGLILMEWPQFNVSNNILRGSKGGYALQLSKNTMGTIMPIGMAANLIASNVFPPQYTDPSDLKSAIKTNNFEEMYGKPVSALPACAGKEAAPYYDDGICKQSIAAKTCPPSQTLLPDGNCGCGEGTALDTQLNVCVKTVEKVVEKIIEKAVEKIVEKPVFDVAKNGIQPIVANPGSGGSGCSLTETATAASPVLAFLVIITISGLVAYRSQPKKVQATQKERRHG